MIEKTWKAIAFKKVCPGHKRRPWQRAVSALNMAETKPPLRSIFVSLFEGDSVLSPRGHTFRHFTYYVFLPPNACNKIRMLLSIL